jgi:hypothetical protein
VLPGLYFSTDKNTIVKERGELTHLRAPRFDPPGRRD